VRRYPPSHGFLPQGSLLTIVIGRGKPTSTLAENRQRAGRVEGAGLDATDAFDPSERLMLLLETGPDSGHQW
jgi:hypothetical protein